MSIHCGSFSATSQPVTGLPGTPGFIIFTGTNRTEYDSIVTTGARGGFIGFACSEIFDTPFPIIKNYSEFVMMAGGACSVLSENAIFAQHTAGSYNNAGLHLYRGSVTAFNPGSFDVNFAVSDPSSTIYYMAFCGIDGSASFIYEAAALGTSYDILINRPSSVVLAIGNWRGNGLTIPKITSSERWYQSAIADVAGGTGVLGAEWIYHTWSGGDSRLTQRYDNAVNQPGTVGHIGVLAEPFVFGTTIPLGFLEASQTGVDDLTLHLEADYPGGDGYAIGVMSEVCVRMECAPVSAQPSPGSQTLETLTEIGSAEAVICFNDMENTPMIQANSDGRWGFGFATPSFQYGWACDNNGGGPFYQTENAAWISSLSATNISMGTIQFFSNSVGFTTTANADGPGVFGMGAFRTYCDFTAPIEMALDPVLQGVPIGTWHTSRGGFAP